MPEIETSNATSSTYMTNVPIGRPWQMLAVVSSVNCRSAFELGNGSANGKWKKPRKISLIREQS